MVNDSVSSNSVSPLRKVDRDRNQTPIYSPRYWILELLWAASYRIRCAGNYLQAEVTFGFFEETSAPKSSSLVWRNFLFSPTLL